MKKYLSLLLALALLLLCGCGTVDTDTEVLVDGEALPLASPEATEEPQEIEDFFAERGISIIRRADNIYLDDGFNIGVGPSALYLNPERFNRYYEIPQAQEYYREVGVIYSYGYDGTNYLNLFPHKQIEFFDVVITEKTISSPNDYKNVAAWEAYTSETMQNCEYEEDSEAWAEQCIGEVEENTNALVADSTVYKIVSFRAWFNGKFNADCVKQAEDGNGNSGVTVTIDLAMVDRYSGTVFAPHINGASATHLVTVGGENYTIQLAFQSKANSVDFETGDISACFYMTALVPADYDGLVFYLGSADEPANNDAAYSEKPFDEYFENYNIKNGSFYTYKKAESGEQRIAFTDELFNGSIPAPAENKVPEADLPSSWAYSVYDWNPAYDEIYRYYADTTASFSYSFDRSREEMSFREKLEGFYFYNETAFSCSLLVIDKDYNIAAASGAVSPGEAIKGIPFTGAAVDEGSCAIYVVLYNEDGTVNDIFTLVYSI